MALDPTIEVNGHKELSQIAGHGSWTNAQRQSDVMLHSGRNDRFAELAYQNAISSQQIATQSQIDYLNDQRLISKLFFGALANKFINQDVEQAIADSQVMKGNSDSSILSILGSLGGSQMAAKIGMTTPPETGVTQLFAQLNALTQQNSSTGSQIAAAALAGYNAMNQTNQSTNAALVALSQALGKYVQTIPPETGK